jgi:hypothetical protein
VLFCVGYFQDRVLWAICPGCLWITIPLISASWVRRQKTPRKDLILNALKIKGYTIGKSLFPNITTVDSKKTILCWQSLLMKGYIDYPQQWKGYESWLMYTVHHLPLL